MDRGKHFILIPNLTISHINSTHNSVTGHSSNAHCPVTSFVNQLIANVIF